MDSSTLIAVLSLGTLAVVIALGLLSKLRTDARRQDPTAPKSTLAKDGPDGGTEMLDPGPGITPTPKPHAGRNTAPSEKTPLAD